MTSAIPLRSQLISATWTQLAGSRAHGAGAYVRPFDETRNGLAYTLKKIFEPDGDWDFRNLDLNLSPDDTVMNARMRRRFARHARRVVTGERMQNSPALESARSGHRITVELLNRKH